MKKIILIISAALLALGILGCAVTALPTLLEGEKYMNNIIDKNSEKQEFTFTDTFSGLDISVLSANANISYNNGNEVKVSYVTVDKNMKIECNITDGTLNIKEKSGFSFFSLFTLASVPTKIEISFPESYRDNGTLENADVTVASGSLSGDMPHTEKSTKIQLYSGKINSSVAAENFDINVSSGSADISSRTHKHKNVNVSVLSGKTTLDGFISEKSKYSLTSGKITSLNAGGGELYTNVTSGSLTLGCAEKITGIDAKVASGKAHISVPKDTGAQVAYSVASGSIKIGLDGRNEKLTGSGSISYGNAEANINVNVASGSFILDTYTLSE
jgi:lia operon protein LiaG